MGQVRLEDARRIIAAAEKKAQEIGQPMNIAVADADFLDRRRLDLRDERRQIEIAAGAPAVAEEMAISRLRPIATRAGCETVG